MGWYIHRQGQAVPVDVHQLRMMAQGGELKPEDLVYPPDGGAWQPASSVDLLADDWPQQAPPPSLPKPVAPAIVVPRQPSKMPDEILGERAWHARDRKPSSTWQEQVKAGAADVTTASVEDLLRRAWDLYLANWQAILITCAVLLLPAALFKAVLHGALGLAARLGPGGFLFALCSLVVSFASALIIQGLAMPLTRAALTVHLADLVTGTPGDWQRSWSVVLRRLVPLLTAIIPAALITAVGLVLFVLPGIVAGCLFAFVAPVVLCEGKSGVAALKRSIELVLTDWVRIALVFVILAVLNAAAHVLAGLAFVPARFFGSLTEELITLALLPLPLTATVLLYVEARRRVDGVDMAALRDQIEK